MKDNKNKIEENNSKLTNFINKQTDFKVYELLIFSFLIVVITIFLTFVVMKDISDNKANSNKKTVDLSEVEEVYDLIKKEYFKGVDSDKLVEGAIKGMLESLDDPHTSYMNKAETDNFSDVMNGSYEGIGAEISINKDNNVIVVSVFKNSPAAEAGLKFNDIIIMVNDKDTKGLTPTQVVALIKDNTKKTAKIKINRDGKELEFEIEKRNIIIDSVESKVFTVEGKKIGYVLINNFANNTYSQFKQHIEDMEKQNISGLVIDVRGNSGGYLHSVTSMIDMFLPKGKVSYQIADRKTTTKYTATTPESRNYPIAILVNKASASASEILAVSLKESYGADVVGTSTYGKGTVQTTKNLTSGGMIKYTIQKWLSPKGNWINEVGVKPTIEVELSDKYQNEPTEENDNQLQKALNTVANK